MADKCDITGKGKQFGNNRSKSLRATKKAWKPNLQTKTMVIDGQKVRLKLAASTIRTLKKYERELESRETASNEEKERQAVKK